MADADQQTFIVPERLRVRPAFVLLGVAWLIWLLGLARGALISSQFVEPGDDVTDSLRRAVYIAVRLVVFDDVSLVAGTSVGIVLLWARDTSGWNVLAWVLLVPSMLLHGLGFLVHLVVEG